MAAVPWERHPHRLHSRSSSGWSSRGSGSLSPPSPTSLCAPRPVRCFRVLYIYDGPLHPGDAFYDAVKEKVECQFFQYRINPLPVVVVMLSASFFLQIDLSKICKLLISCSSVVLNMLKMNHHKHKIIFLNESAA